MTLVDGDYDVPGQSVRVTVSPGIGGLTNRLQPEFEDN